MIAGNQNRIVKKEFVLNLKGRPIGRIIVEMDKQVAFAGRVGVVNQGNVGKAKFRGYRF